MIASLFPPGVVAVTGTPDMASGHLYPEEEACIRGAVAKRRGEFTVGRVCARQALVQLGIERFPLVSGPDRAPVWPAGVVGSVTHCSGFCAVVAARRDRIQGLGIDAEPAAALPPELIPRICTPAEISWVAAAIPPPSGDWYRLIFSAKEAVYKCCYPATRQHLDFLDVEVNLESEVGRFAVRFLRAASWLATGTAPAGRFYVMGGQMVTSAAITS